jgi:hypothetical protein
MLALSFGMLASCARPAPSPWIPTVLVPSAKVDGAAASTAIRSIEITTSGVLVSEQIERLEAFSTRQRLQDELTKQLFAAGRYGEGGALQVFLQVTEFRLRTHSMVRWAGAMAGPDLLGIKARVVKSGVDVSTFETGVSTTVRPSPSYANEEGRLDRMVAELSRRIIAALPALGR